MKTRLLLLLTCVLLLSPLTGCKDIAGNIKARFGKLAQGITSAAPAGNFGSTAEEKAMVNAVTKKYGDLQQFGNPRILELMVSSSVVNHIPSDRVSQFSSSAPKFHAWFIYDNFSEGTVSIEWLYLDDNYSIGTLKAKAGKDFGRGAFILEAPDDGWPLGKYRVKVSGQGVTEQVDFQVIKGNTVSTAILLPDGSVDLAGAGSPSARNAKTGGITTGKSTALVSQSIGASGGSIVISKPGDPLDGMVIGVPEGAYAGNRTFKVSSAPIEGQTFGSVINPITPMITVENGGGYSKEIMYVRVPVKAPDGYFAMGFFYNENSKQLEGMPLVGIDDQSITLATRHFSSFFISMIEKAMLSDDTDSGFTPGIDDWQFKNLGSFITPGHCEGQSLTAMWYYCTQPDGEGMCLYNRYDNNGYEPDTPDLWQDDSLGYRFCSVIQKDIDGESFSYEFWDNLGGIAWEFVNNNWVMKKVPGIGDQATFNLFSYSIRATGEPQEVGIWSNAGGGHAMIVYKIVGNALYIADPNYPGDTVRKIIYYSGTGKFKPYNSGANRVVIEAGKGQLFETIIYSGKSTIVPYEKIAQRWTEFKAGTIGNDKFPGYTLRYIDATNRLKELKNGEVTTNRFFRISMYPSHLYCHIYRDGKKLVKDSNLNIELLEGNNRLGIYIWGLRDGEECYVDFQYMDVVYQSDEKPDTEFKCSWNVDYSKLTKVDKTISLSYVDEQKRVQGMYISWYGGDKSKRHEMGCYKDDKKEGVWTTWWENGNKSKQETWKDDKLNGPFSSWQKDGSENEQGQYTDNKRSGVWTVFNYLKGYDSKWDYDTDTRVEGPENGLWKH